MKKLWLTGQSWSKSSTLDLQLELTGTPFVLLFYYSKKVSCVVLLLLSLISTQFKKIYTFEMPRFFHVCLNPQIHNPNIGTETHLDPLEQNVDEFSVCGLLSTGYIQ